MAHWEKVVETAEKFSEISESVVRKADKDLVESASRMFEETLDDSDLYQEYVSQFGFEPNENLEYHELTPKQKRYKDLLRAESYFTLYVLALSIKEMNSKVGFRSVIQVGSGDINVEDADNFVKRRNLYLTEAKKIISMVSSGANGSGGITWLAV